jgi:signal transduction histidine kinase
VFWARTPASRARSPPKEDLAFLQSVANTLALAIERREAEKEVTVLADERRRIMADALDAEDRTRERISQLLHDEVLAELRNADVALHPVTLA